MPKILTKQEYAKMNLDEGKSINSALYLGSRKENAVTISPEVVQFKDQNNNLIYSESIVQMNSTKWKDSEGYHSVWNRIKAIAMRVSKKENSGATLPNDYYTLFDLFRIDITRRRLENIDYTGLMTEEIVNEAFTESIRLLEFLPFAAPFKKIEGRSDSVNLIEQKTGDDDTVVMSIYAVGWKEDLMNALYNVDLNKMQRVMEAVERGFRAQRNDLSIGQLPRKTLASGWNAGQQVPAATGGDTYLEDLYNTLNNGIHTLSDLYNFQTQQKIDPSEIVLVTQTGSVVRDINRAINGDLNLNGKGKVGNYTALEISQIWPYRGDTIFYGKEKIVYPGVADQKAYMFVPGPAGAPIWTLVKRALTQEIGDGSVLQLSQEERAWYFVQTRYFDEFFGSSAGNTKIDNDTSGNIFGYVVEITLPSPASP